MWPLWLVEMSLQHIQKNSPRLLPKPAKFEKNPPNGYRVIRKTKCGAGGAGGARSSPIHKQASLAGRLIKQFMHDIEWGDWRLFILQIYQGAISGRYECYLSKTHSLKITFSLIIGNYLNHLLDYYM